MAKEIMKPASVDGAFIEKGDTVKFEVPFGTRTMMVIAVEINMRTGEAIIHGKGDDGYEWNIAARNVQSVFNKKLNLKEKI